MRYTVKHAYTAVRDGKRFGPWSEGQEVTLEDHEAEWVLRDSPEVVEPVKQERAQPPAVDRQHRGAKNRSRS